MSARLMLCTALCVVGGAPLALADDYAGGAIKSAETSAGEILTDANGMTLYTFDKDSAGMSNCYDDCAVNWPPLIAAAGATGDEEYTLVERKDGTIVIVSSIGGLRGSPVIGAYNISKAADFQLARNLAVEYGPHNSRVNCIAPGLIKTDFAKALWDNPELGKSRAAATPLRRLGDPEDIAGIAVYLVSKAGSWTTGQTIVVDGGVDAG